MYEENRPPRESISAVAGDNSTQGESGDYGLHLDLLLSSRHHDGELYSLSNGKLMWMAFPKCHPYLNTI